jgi:2,4-dienoyl-CoA reductase (NADPH2)
VIEGALKDHCDMVAIARPLLANPDLLSHLRNGVEPDRPCSFCSLCCAKTAFFPLGCWDKGRFGGDEQKMLNQILAISSPDAPYNLKGEAIKGRPQPPGPCRNDQPAIPLGD